MLRKFVYVRQCDGVAEDGKSSIDAATRDTIRKKIKQDGVPRKDGRHEEQPRDSKYKTLSKERRRKTPTTQENVSMRNRHGSYYDDWQRGHVPLNYEHFLYDKTRRESKRNTLRWGKTFVSDDEPELTKVEIIFNGSIRTLFVQKKENAARMDDKLLRGKNTCLCEKVDVEEGFLCKEIVPRIRPIKLCDATIRKTDSVCSPTTYSERNSCRKLGTYSKNKGQDERKRGESKSKVQFSLHNDYDRATSTDQNEYQLKRKQVIENRKQHQIHKMDKTNGHKKSKDWCTYMNNTETPERHICHSNDYEKKEEHFFINLPGVHREIKGENMPFESMLDNIHEFNEVTQYSRKIFPREMKTCPKKPQGVPRQKENEHLNYDIDFKINDFADKGVFDGTEDHELFISYLEKEISDSEDTNYSIFLCHSPAVLSIYPRKKKDHKKHNYKSNQNEFQNTDLNDELANEKDPDVLSCSKKELIFSQVLPNISKFTLDILNSTAELQNDPRFGVQNLCTTDAYERNSNKNETSPEPSKTEFEITISTDESVAQLDQSASRKNVSANLGIQKLCSTDAHERNINKNDTFPDTDFEITVSTDESVVRPYEQTKTGQNVQALESIIDATVEEDHRRFLIDPYLAYINSDDWKKKLLDKQLSIDERNSSKTGLRFDIKKCKLSPRKPILGLNDPYLVATNDYLFSLKDSSEKAANQIECNPDQSRNIDKLGSEITQLYEKTISRRNVPAVEDRNNATVENHKRFLIDPYLEYVNSNTWKKNLLDKQLSIDEKHEPKNNLMLVKDKSKQSSCNPTLRITNPVLLDTKDNLFLSIDFSETAANQIRNIDNLGSEIPLTKVIKDLSATDSNRTLRIQEPAKNSFEHHFDKPAKRIHYPNSNPSSNENYIIEKISINDDSHDDDLGDNYYGDNNHKFQNNSQKMEDETKTGSDPILRIGEPLLIDNYNYKPFMYSRISDSELKRIKKYLNKVSNSISESSNRVYCPENKGRNSNNRCLDKSRYKVNESKKNSNKIKNDTVTKFNPVLKIGDPLNLKNRSFKKNSLSNIELKTKKDFQTEPGLKKSSKKVSKVNSDLNNRFKYNIYQEILEDNSDSGDNSYSDDSSDEDINNGNSSFGFEKTLLKVNKPKTHSTSNNDYQNKKNFRSNYLEKSMLRNKDCVADTGIKLIETTPLNPVAELRPLFEMNAEPSTITPINSQKKKIERRKRCASVGVTTVECPTVPPYRSKQAMFQYELAEDGWLAEKKGIVGLKDLHKGELNIDDDINHVIKMYSSACIALGSIKLMF